MPSLRGGAAQSAARTVLEGESGFNDPVGISLMVVALSHSAATARRSARACCGWARSSCIGSPGGIVGRLPC